MAASKGFNYKVVHFLELEDRYAIDGRLLGKRICFLAREDCRVEIVFPTIIRINGCDTLGIPGIQDDIKVDSKNWGKINSYRN